MGHHAPEAIATTEFQDAGGWALSEYRGAHRPPKKLEEEQSAQRLAMELVEVDRKRVGIGRIG